MSVPALLEPYAYMSILAFLRESQPTLIVNSIGMRPNTDGEQWVDYYPMGDARTRSRKDYWMGRVLWQLSCNSRIEEGRADRDTMAPFRLASLVSDLFEHTDLPVRRIGAGEDIVGVLNISEARQRYLPRRNITFQGEGNFSVEQGNVHTVVVTFQATLVVV